MVVVDKVEVVDETKNSFGFRLQAKKLSELPNISIAAFLMAYINAKMLSAFSHKIDWNFLSNFLTICLHLALQQPRWQGRRRGWQGGSWQGAPRVQNWQLVQAQAFLTRENLSPSARGVGRNPGGQGRYPGGTDRSFLEGQKSQFPLVLPELQTLQRANKNSFHLPFPFPNSI